MSPIRAIFNWYYFLKGPEVLIWRLETFGFLFPSDLDQKARDYLNKLAIANNVDPRIQFYRLVTARRMNKWIHGTE